jgi:predicted acylesterase/phospholipase RssA
MSATSSSSGGTGRKHQKTQIGPKRKIAFVCSGGATKAGAFHLGVALALQEHGFRFYGGTAAPSGNPIPGPMDISTYVGSSAGSIICSYLAAGYSLDNIFNSFLSRKPQEPIDPIDVTPKILPRLTYQKMFKFRSAIAREQISQFTFMRNTIGKLMAGDWEALFQLQWLRATGIFSTSGLEQYIREEVLVSNRFQDCLADLFIVATQLNHSRKVVFGKYSYQPPAWELNCQYDNDVEISQACAASAALPIIFAPYPIKNKNNHTMWYIDGEIRDTLSTHVAIDAGADLVFASYTHQPYHFMKEIGSLTDFGLPSIAVQSIYLLIEQKINNHIFNKKIQRETIRAVSKYCKDQGISEDHRLRILEIMETGLHHRQDVDTIYIHPRADDAQMFFGEHFTLSPQKMSDIVKSGFRAAVETLKNYEFADRREELAVGTTGTD